MRASFLAAALPAIWSILLSSAAAFAPPLESPLRLSLASSPPRPAPRLPSRLSARSPPPPTPPTPPSPSDSARSLFLSSSPSPLYTWSSGLSLNLYGFYYAFVAISNGLWWYAAVKACQLLYLLSRALPPRLRADRGRRLPVLLSSLWGRATLLLTCSSPLVTNRAASLAALPPGAACMFVANHCSWMDIPYASAAVAPRNYKTLAKRELLRVPILGAAIAAGGNVVVDRTSRRSQIETYKRGLEWLRGGVDLFAFPEGTR
ncbi:hypothetical protein TeGR_g4605 [Tetraparma gracilis]|uniref:Phospholipid/glycerol acyltransferase domain-containing protein n=1 Tax=Tetraparma gracilis TaxID=2962635 RepID=A0ABQ6MN42_9STRA|nr:hypothetical protein TeGR_g4605 [Tetraparma gracilis]